MAEFKYVWTVLLVSYLCSLFTVSNCKGRYVWTTCDGVPGKVPGRVRIIPGFVIAYEKPYGTIYNTTSVVCRNSCFKDVKCRLAEYITQSYSKRNDALVKLFSCRMFNAPFFIKRTFQGNIVIYWSKCKLKRPVCQDMGNGRCLGIFVSYPNYRVNQSRFGPFLTYNKTETYKSMSDCLDNKICGSINFNRKTKTSEFNTAWPNPLIHKTLVLAPNWTAIIWTCCTEVKESIDKTPVWRSGFRCPGYWDLDNKSMNISKIDFLCRQFSTISALACRKECTNQPEGRCFKPFYNSTLKYCFLAANMNHTSACVSSNFVNRNLTMTSYKWVSRCKKNSSNTSGINNTTVSKVKFGSLGTFSNCVCIKEKQRVEIKEDYCNQPVKSSSDKRVVYNEMAFRISNSYSSLYGKKWFKASTGLDIVWLHEINSTIDSDITAWKSCDQLQCDIYNAKIDKKMLTNKYIQRSAWGAFHEQDEGGNIFKSGKPYYVVFGRARFPLCSCFTQESCSYAVYERQVFYLITGVWKDIPENFLIGSDGNVYECRGWSKWSAAVNEYNSVSITISFIGDFEYESPSLSALNAAKRLIEFGVRKKKLPEDYCLFAHRDLRDKSNEPGLKLYGIIQNWSRYKCRKIDKFCHIKLIYILLLVFGTLLVIGIIILIVLQQLSMFHQSLCRLLKRHWISNEEDIGRLHFIPLHNCSLNLEENETNSEYLTQFSKDIIVQKNPNELNINTATVEVIFLIEKSIAVKYKLYCDAIDQIIQQIKQMGSLKLFQYFNNPFFARRCQVYNITNCFLLLEPQDKVLNRCVLIGFQVHHSNWVDKIFTFLLNFNINDHSPLFRGRCWCKNFIIKHYDPDSSIQASDFLEDSFTEEELDMTRSLSTVNDLAQNPSRIPQRYEEFVKTFNRVIRRTEIRFSELESGPYTWPN